MAEQKRFVQFESPYGAETADGIVRNVTYALIGMRHSLEMGEAPFASHLLYTQMLDDAIPLERTLGIFAGLRIGEGAEATVVYEDLGISRGMEMGINHAIELGRPVEYRKLYPHLTGIAELSARISQDAPLDPEIIRRVYARNM